MYFEAKPPKLQLQLALLIRRFEGPRWQLTEPRQKQHC